MAFKKITSILVVMALAVMMTACSEDKTVETTAAATTVAETTVAETTAEEVVETTVEETEPYVNPEAIEIVSGVPYNVENSTDFAEPVLYEVVEEVNAYTDWQANAIAVVYPVGSCISAISTDGTYVMQDNGYIIEVSALQIME
ncbi:MAG: hypothetical protein MJ166_03055 [Clostridia bacterium]|nr:hypothetical protein [Clostridia bacterium]